jgi:GrpB-like predicted nucleotidyltransferase (UPF0157 family)
MKIGLKKGMVELIDHQPDWEKNAVETIEFLKKTFGNIIIDIQHIGSTAIKNIKAKPIIDIVVGINDFDYLDNNINKLDKNGIIHRPRNDQNEYRMYVIGNMEKEIRTHHIHVVKHNGEEWNNQLNFRDYMNNNYDELKNYEKLKIKLLKENKENRENYTKSKDNFIMEIFIKAEKWRKEQISKGKTST